MVSKTRVLGVAIFLSIAAIAYLWQEDMERDASLVRLAKHEDRLQESKHDGASVSELLKGRIDLNGTMDGRELEEANSPSGSTSVHAVKLEALRPMIESAYMFSELVDALGLDARTADELILLLAEHLLNAKENPPNVPAGQLEWAEGNEPEWVLKQEVEQRQNNAEIAALLGEPQYSAFRDYVDSVEARRWMRGFQATLAGTPDALAKEQFLPLVKAVADGQQRYVAERGKYATPTGLEQTARYHERMREAARPYLSLRQYEQFSQSLELEFEKAQQRIRERVSRAENYD